MIRAATLRPQAGRRPITSRFGEMSKPSGRPRWRRRQATPWLNITPDLQWLRPGLGAISTDNAFVYGVRANATF